MQGGQKHEYQLTNNRNQKLFCKFWPPGEKFPKKLVFLCHGLGEHSGRYSNLIEKLTNEGCYVFTHDHVGHGRSEGSRVHIDDFNFFVKDVHQHVLHAKKQFPLVPCFMLSHSMGGAIAILLGAEQPDLFEGVVMIAPAIGTDPNVATPLKKFFAKFFAQLLPELEIGSLGEDLMTRNKEEVQAYLSDPLCWQGGVKAKMGVEIMKAFKMIEKKQESFKVPYLLIHGTCDGICLIDASRSFHQQTSSHDKTFIEYPGAYHAVHCEPEGQGEKAIQDIVSWICSR